MPARRKCLSLAGKPAGSIIAAANPRQAHIRKIVPAFCGMSGCATVKASVCSGCIFACWTSRRAENGRGAVTIAWLYGPTPGHAPKRRPEAVRHGYCFHDGARLFDSHGTMPGFEDIMT